MVSMAKESTRGGETKSRCYYHSSATIILFLLISFNEKLWLIYSIMMLHLIVSNAHGHELELEVGESKSLYADGSKIPAEPFFTFICNKESI